ncbi:MAG TPA: 3-deoxy-manno-octulosonate cytidylyltransferase [Syntrophales bacterium]|nr:3-deoxy-manno-octulosonate cytidylyltransferase [Syntrophales bacterium]HOM06558.1 3-deoxy-manno-octulosonate cytidylyltransferase [Syntrophales bacterium]HON99659.1 3-deoxy-manno-octulosonate cytidylyltransferase [Syntrophales bacterium]HPC00670.1 3-deoxy-manno-octulosonate cytidylyltransferase [Syntrophales bacterium]HPQ06180.1 3-deoxy-manno-octulosonate cytidylyltransferase [Syntrophales bacterium]
MKVVGIIPSRYESSRFPGKPLAPLMGKPMIQHVYERVRSSPLVDLVAVATDDDRIREAVAAFGGRAVMTASRHRSGTDRLHEAAEILGLSNDTIVINIQGDQPLFHPRHIEEVTTPLLEDPDLPMSTLIYRIVRPEEIHHPNAVKTVCTQDGFALYFSRSTIPFVRDGGQKAVYYKHHGIYAYRRSFLRLFASLPTGRLERLEALEQLRALEHGYRIKVVETDHDSVEVDTEEDLRRVEEIMINGRQDDP